MSHIAARHIAPAKQQPGINQTLTVILPCAGIGQRMKSRGTVALIDVGGMTVLERHLNNIWEVYPSAEIIVVVGFEANKIIRKFRNKPVRFIYNANYRTTNVAYSIGLALQANTSSRVLIVYGDLVYTPNTISGVVQGESTVVIDTQQNMLKEEVGVVVRNGYVQHFSYAMQIKWAQIAYLTGKELKLFTVEAWQQQHHKWFGYEIFNLILDRKCKLLTYEPNNMKLVEIDTTTDILRAQSI